MKRYGTDFAEHRRVRRDGPSVSASHLLVAQDVLNASYWGSSQIALCGAEIHSGGAVIEAGEDPGYCQKCVRAAVRWSTRRTAR